MIADGFRDCILANAFRLFCFLQGLFTCMQQKPTQTQLVDTIRTTNGNPNASDTKNLAPSPTVSSDIGL